MKILITILLILGFAMILSIQTIDEGQKGLVLRFGKINNEISTGFNFINPFLDRVIIFKIRNNKYEDIINAGTIDLQTATIQVAVNYEVDSNKISEIYKTFGEDYLDRIFKQNVPEGVKSVSSKLSAPELIIKRDYFKGEVIKKISETTNNLVKITDVAIVDIDFSESFNRAIEEKVVAEQEASKAKNLLEKSKSEAEALRIQTEAINQSGGERYIQLKAIEKWNGVLPTYYSKGDLPFLLNR